MKLLISLAAPATFKKDDRVVVKIKKDEWYTGTVKSFGKKLRIAFDDGEVVTVDPEDFKLVKLLIKNKKTKKHLTNEEAKALYTKTIQVLRPKPTKVAKTTRAEPEKVLPKHVGIDPTRKGKQIPEDLYLKCGNAAAFTKTNTKSGRLYYLHLAYNKANQTIFDNRLNIPTIYLMKTQKTSSFRGRGIWKPVKRQLGISPRLFNAGEAHVLNTLVHEMCHQAVIELDKYYGREEGGHGRHWRAWMAKTGIPVSRYDMTDFTEYMTDDEKKTHTDRVTAVKNAKEGKTEIIWMHKGKPAMFFDPRTKAWEKGVIVGPTRGKLAFIKDPSKSSWTLLPNKGKGWLYEMPDEERPKYETQVWKDAVERTLDSIETNKEVRAQRRALRRLY
jgi:hypothetical protein